METIQDLGLQLHPCYQTWPDEGQAQFGTDKKVVLLHLFRSMGRYGSKLSVKTGQGLNFILYNYDYYKYNGEMSPSKSDISP